MQCCWRDRKEAAPMPYDDDPDLWQTSRTQTSRTPGPTREALVPRREAGRAESPRESGATQQPRLNLQMITDLLTRAARDLRATEQRALEAQERAKTAEEKLAALQMRADAAESLERKVTAQAVRAFETMKQRIAESEAREQESHAKVQTLEERLRETERAMEQRAAQAEKAAEERRFQLESRLEAAEMRITAARRALGENAGAIVEEAAARSPIATVPEVVGVPLRH
jgi:hypothetical protein